MPSLLTATMTEPSASLSVMDSTLVPVRILTPELLVLLLDLLGDLGVLVGQRAGQELDDGDVDAVVLHHVGELHADRAGAGDDDRLRQVPRQDLLLVGDDVLRQRRAGHQPGAAAGGDDGVVEGDRLGSAVVQLDLERVGVGELAVAVDLGDLVLLHQEVHAGDAAFGDLAAAVERHAVVEGGLAADAERLGFLGEDVGELGVAQQRLRRDAADIEAHPAPVLGFDDGGVQPELGGADRRDVSAGAGSENDDVIVGHAAYPSATTTAEESRISRSSVG